MEARAAELFGKESALFVPTGTMGNTIAIKLHTRHGEEVICDARSHVLDWELSMMAWFAGSNGTNWTVQSGVPSANWEGVAYGNGTFVAVDGSGQVMSSTNNGVTWTSQTGTGTYLWTSIAYGNGVFVAVAGGGQIMTSVNGIVWTAQTSALPTASHYTITYGNGLFVTFANPAVMQL